MMTMMMMMIGNNGDDIIISIPDVFISLNVNLMKHGVFNGSCDVGFHLHGNVTWQHRQ